MDCKVVFILFYIFGVVTVESTRHHHGPHHNHTRRVPNHLADLKNRILHGYDNNINPDNKVVVQMGWTLLDVHLCSHKQVLTVSSYTVMQWKDERLAWEGSSVQGDDGVDAINIPYDHIWIPDIVAFTLTDMKENFVPWGTVNVLVQKDGSIIFIPPVTMKTWCNVNYENWPFGEQSCDIKLGSWTHGSSQLDIANTISVGFLPKPLPCSSDCFDVEHFQNNQVEIISTSVAKNNKKYPGLPETYPRLEINIKFKRLAKYEKGELHCANLPSITALHRCNTTMDCPCGLNHCHLLAVSSPDGRGVCTPTPREQACTFNDDCKTIGSEFGNGKLGVQCSEDGKCVYDGAIMMA